MLSHSNFNLLYFKAVKYKKFRKENNMSVQRFFSSLLITLVSLLNFCGVTPDLLEVIESHLEINAIFTNNQNLSKIKETSFDSLIVEINGDDTELIRKCIKIDPNNLVLKDTIINVPAGKKRKVNVYTVNKSGQKTHADSVKNRVIDIEPKSINILNVTLIPVSGSIYIQIGGTPAGIKTIKAKFTSKDKQIWETEVKRNNPRPVISLDNLPDGISGVVEIFEIDSTGDTLYYAKKDIKIDVNNSEIINLSFNSFDGSFLLDIIVKKPELTIISIGNEVFIPADTETGELVITEIMYAADGDEYIEVHNAENTTQIFDSLYIDIDGKYYLFTDIIIKPDSFYVFGRNDNLWWVNQANPVKSALNLSSKGNWITLRNKDSTIIDQVIFTGSNNDLEWPKTSGKQSIVLVKDKETCGLNNFGRNWIPAETLIDSTLDMYGTPQSW